MKYAIIAATAILLGVALYAGIHQAHQAEIPQEVRAQFQKWKVSQNRLYGSPSEDHYRLSIFHKNLRMIEAHNAQAHSYTLGINQFADMTKEEFLAKYSGGPFVPPQEPTEYTELSLKRLPASRDWSQKGVVTPIKNQGRCGSCWSFSTTGAIEGLKAIRGHGLTSLSEQQLIDCTRGSYMNHGCSGGVPLKAMMYVINKGGIETESAYPYQGKVEPCRAKLSKFVYKIKGVGRAKPLDNDGLKAAVANQPVSVIIDCHSIMFYKGGIINQGCGQALNHAVLAVGYGTSGKTPYWKVKNSWGAKWGEKGYMRILRKSGKGKTPCGINIFISWPTA